MSTFRKELLKLIDKDSFDLIKQGDFRGFAACKTIIDKLKPNEVQNILMNSNNATISNEKKLKPSKVYQIKKPQGSDYDNMLKSIDFKPYDDYFYKNIINEEIYKYLNDNVLKIINNN